MSLTISNNPDLMTLHLKLDDELVNKLINYIRSHPYEFIDALILKATDELLNEDKSCQHAQPTE